MKKKGKWGVDLARRDPERPLAARVLDQDAHEALDGAEDGAVDDDGADQLVVAVHKLQVWAVSRGSMMDEFVRRVAERSIGR